MQIFCYREQISTEIFLHMRYDGTDCALICNVSPCHTDKVNCKIHISPLIECKSTSDYSRISQLFLLLTVICNYFLMTSFDIKQLGRSSYFNVGDFGQVFTSR